MYPIMKIFYKNTTNPAHLLIIENGNYFADNNTLKYVYFHVVNNESVKAATLLCIEIQCTETERETRTAQIWQFINQQFPDAKWQEIK